MSDFTVRFEWPAAAGDGAELGLLAATREQAKVKAAILFACQDFEGLAPRAYGVFEGEIEIYRYEAASTSRR